MQVFSRILFGTVIFFLLPIVFNTGSLLPFWMFLNSMSLIAHIPMLNINLPAGANYFLLGLLDILRFNIGQLNLWLRQQVQGSDELDFELVLNDEVAFYTPLLYACGYSFSIWPNLIPYGCILALILILWVFACMIDLVKCCCNRKPSYESKMTNCIVRFFYEVFFEVILCAFINASYIKPGDVNGYVLSIVLICLICVSMLIICLTVRCGGPKHYGVYEKCSFMNYFWGFRSLRQEQIEVWKNKLNVSEDQLNEE